MQTIYGHVKSNQPHFIKSTFYDANRQSSIVSERSPEKHRVMRRQLSHAFSAAALREQSDIVIRYADAFMEQIRKYGGGEKGIDVAEWYNYITFDIIGDLAFGESFHAVEKAQSHEWIDIILNSIFAGTMFEIYRRLPILKLTFPVYFPVDKSFLKQRETHLRLSLEKVRLRMGKSNDRLDFFSHLLSEKKAGLLEDMSDKEMEQYLQSTASTLIIAGSETTTTLLSGLTCHLLRNPSVLRTLESEIRSAFSSSADITGDSAARLPYLNAVIEEALRLFPPVAFGLPRISPGAVVDGEFIPRGTVISSHSYTITRSPAYFAYAESFRPERFLPSSHELYDPVFDSDVKEALKPFSLGSRACLGINLAYLELRVIVAKLVWNFDMELASGRREELDEWLAGVRMLMLLKKPGLNVRFRPVVRDGREMLVVA